MRQAGPNWPSAKLLCRNNQYNQYSPTGTPSMALPVAVTPSTTPGRPVCQGILGSAGKWSGCACGHGSSHPAPCGSSSQGWWLPTGLVVAHGMMDERGSDRSLHPNPAFLHTQRRLANLRALYSNEVWSSSVSIKRMFASDITYRGI